MVKIIKRVTSDWTPLQKWTMWLMASFILTFVGWVSVTANTAHNRSEQNEKDIVKTEKSVKKNTSAISSIKQSQARVEAKIDMMLDDLKYIRDKKD